ncbi:hypothetical protein EOM09_04940 [bacterium]|nr:hypothetical protein [bacterium]
MQKQKIQPFKKKEIEKYTRKRFSLEVSKKGKEKVLEHKLLSKLKHSKFICVDGATNLFDLANKKVFVKESIVINDYYQFKDYLNQKKVISNIPEIYGVLKLNNGRIYIFSKHISDAVPLTSHLFRSRGPDFLKKVRLEVKTIGEKLVEKGLLPWDFQLKQFFYSPKASKVYLSDNAISFYNPKTLVKYFKKANVEIPTKLKKIYLIYSLHPFQISREGLKFINQKTKNILFNSSTKLSALKRDGNAMFEKRLFSLINNTVDFYTSLPLETKQKIQSVLLKECLEEFNSIKF